MAPFWLSVLLLGSLQLLQPSSGQASEHADLLANFNNFKDVTGSILEGLKANEFSANSTNCLNSIEGALYEYLDLVHHVGVSKSFSDISLSVTKQLQNLSEDILICFDAFDDAYHRAVWHYSRFEGLTDYFTSMFQNLLGNAINF